MNSDDLELLSEGHGIVLGRLQARLLDRMIVGDMVLFLASGTQCDYPIGTALRVTYTELEGIKEAFRVERVVEPEGADQRLGRAAIAKRWAKRKKKG